MTPGIAGPLRAWVAMTSGVAGGLGGSVRMTRGIAGLLRRSAGMPRGIAGLLQFRSGSAADDTDLPPDDIFRADHAARFCRIAGPAMRHVRGEPD
jgi:hypothetical protein